LTAHLSKRATRVLPHSERFKPVHYDGFFSLVLSATRGAERRLPVVVWGFATSTHTFAHYVKTVDTTRPDDRHLLLVAMDDDVIVCYFLGAQALVGEVYVIATELFYIRLILRMVDAFFPRAFVAHLEKRSNVG
jgi:voltage-gated potassium channel Kch